MKHEDLLKLEAEKRKELEDIKKQIKYYEHRARLIAHIQDLDSNLEQEKKRLQEFRDIEKNHLIQNDTRPFFAFTLLYYINPGNLGPINQYRFTGSYIGAYLGKQDSTSTLFATDGNGNEIYINSLKNMIENYPTWDSLQQTWGNVFRIYNWTEENHTAFKHLLEYVIYDTTTYVASWNMREGSELKPCIGGFSETKRNTEKVNTITQSKELQLKWQHTLQNYSWNGECLPWLC